MKKRWRNLRKSQKILLTIFGAVLALAAMLYAVYALTINPYRGVKWEHLEAIVNGYTPFPSEPLDAVLTRKQAREDLDFTIRHLRSRHPAWKIDKELAEQVEAAYRDTRDSLPEEMTVMELWQEIGTVLAVLHDGHTRVAATPKHYLYLSDETQLEQYGAPIAVDGIPTEQAFQTAKQRMPYEREESAYHNWTKHWLRMRHYAAYSGIDISDGIDLTFETEHGPETFHYGYVTPNLVKKKEEKSTSWVSYSIDKENSLGIFKLTHCKLNEEYKATLEDFFQTVFKEDISNIVVDLRGNGGGNSGVANLFLTYLDADTYKGWRVAKRMGWLMLENDEEDLIKINPHQPQIFSGQVYVLTDIETYSAAMDFAMLLADNDLAIQLGQAPGNMPTAYMDILVFQLPNSGMELEVSHKKCFRVDESKLDEPLTPDYITDQPMEKVYELIAKNESVGAAAKLLPTGVG